MLLQYNARRMTQAAKFAVEKLKSIENGRWKKVLRGAVDWADFPFDRYATAVTVLIDESSFLRRRNRGAMTLEFMTKMPQDVDTPQDEVLGLMRSDAIEVFTALAECTQFDPVDPNVQLILLVDNTTDTCLEVSDATLKIQGVVATAFLEV